MNRARLSLTICTHYWPATYHKNYLAYSDLDTKIDQIEIPFCETMPNTHFDMVLNLYFAS